MPRAGRPGATGSCMRERSFFAARAWLPDRAFWRLRCDVLRFSGMRADYYEYLADMLDGLQGRKSQRDLFHDDALRHGDRTVRGRLARRWVRTLENCGGDLATAWAGSMPSEELALLRAAQAGGAGALIAALRDLARAARVAGQAARIFRDTLLAGLLALCVVSQLGLTGFVMGVEMLYHLTLEGANGSVMSLFHQQVDTRTAPPWMLAGVLLAAGIGGYRALLPRYRAVWGDVHADIVVKQRSIV